MKYMKKYVAGTTALLMSVLVFAGPAYAALKSDPVSSSPLTVVAGASNADPGTTRGNIVVMEFEPWWGPTGINFNYPGVTTKPWTGFPNTGLLASTTAPYDMTSLGGGYSSADPAVIREQQKLIQNLGVDALLVDMTNYNGCTFNASYAQCPGPTEQEKMDQHNIGGAALKANVTALYTQLATLAAAYKSHLKIIPLLGGQDPSDFALDSSGKSGVENGTAWFRALQNAHTNLNVVYEGKPLILYYHGANQLVAGCPSACTWWEQTDTVLATRPLTGTKFKDQIDYRHMGGLFDDQAQNRTLGAINPIFTTTGHPSNGFWTWVDRYSTTPDTHYPSYNLHNGVKEAFTASYAAPGKCPPSNPTCDVWAEIEGLTLANGANGTLNGDAFKRYMIWATANKPVFLMITQWNEYVGPDQGVDANHRNDIEPTYPLSPSTFGPAQYTNYNIVKGQIKAYDIAIGKWTTSPTPPYLNNTGLHGGEQLGYIDTPAFVPGTFTITGWVCSYMDEKPSAVYISASAPLGQPGSVLLTGPLLANNPDGSPDVIAGSTWCNCGGSAFRFAIDLSPWEAANKGKTIYANGLGPTWGNFERLNATNQPIMP